MFCKMTIFLFVTVINLPIARFWFINISCVGDLARNIFILSQFDFAQDTKEQISWS